MLLLGPVLRKQTLVVLKDVPESPIFKTYSALLPLRQGNSIFLAHENRKEKLINVCVIVLLEHLNRVAEEGNQVSPALLSSS